MGDTGKMPSVTYLPSDGERVVVGNFEQFPDAVIFRDDSASVIVHGAPSGDSFAWDINTTREMTLSASALTLNGVNFVMTSGNLALVSGTLDVQDGGAVSQATNRTTGVTLSKYTGKITTQATSLAAGARVSFTVTNTLVAATDHVIVNKVSGDIDTEVTVESVGAGTFNIGLHNTHASAADTTATVISVCVIKGAIA